ncbi:hypothetical protein CAPTEDRAFT_18322 [Capitella teleta]|uniref:Charged multivesicular body protein 2b n=1 Tax=Capitella teleta TaxID=283909 RepID=R7UAQ2_CAPTE|nr:hypothetical protein CAPTEDRAFT_18322 [Capitella teleta]|eukprot:ELU00221.1 hypothetical protein CAPTEDRAFT_18322 [Capitella teleta]
MSFFSKKPTVKDQVRANDKVIKKSQRDLERERRELDRQEKQIESEIKKAAKQNNKQACTVLAKQLINVRNQRTKTYAMGSKMSSIGTQQKLMHSNMKMADAMGNTTKTMATMNKVMDPQKTAQTMRQFEMQNAKMEMTEEMMNDALDDIMNDSGDEEEQSAIVSQVLDEIGIDITGSLADAGAHSGNKVKAPAASSSVEDADLEKMLAQLRS